MLIWSGLGFLVPLLMFASLILFQLVLDSIFGDGFYSAHALAQGAALVFGGWVCTFVAIVVRKRRNEVWVDEETGEEFLFNDSHPADHTIFFVPMHWASIAITFFATCWVCLELLRPVLPQPAA